MHSTSEGSRVTGSPRATDETDIDIMRNDLSGRTPAESATYRRRLSAYCHRFVESWIVAAKCDRLQA